MKKFFILFLVLVFTVCCFTGCKTNSAVETNEPSMPENGIVVTVDPLEETSDAERVLSEISINTSNTK